MFYGTEGIDLSNFESRETNIFIDQFMSQLLCLSMLVYSISFVDGKLDRSV